jgi:DNA-binding NarL/FixJ family response regulator
MMAATTTATLRMPISTPAESAAPAAPAAVSSRTKARVFLVDDHPIVRQGLVQLINQEPDLLVCGEAEDVPRALAAVESGRPDVVVIDLFLRESDGFELIKSLRTSRPALPLLVLSMHKESLHAERALRAGARGYIMKQEATGQVLAALRTVLRGAIYLSPAMSSRLVAKLVDPRGAMAGPSLERLSDREFEVFGLIGAGVGPTEMAARLGLSVKTIEAYRENIKQKLALRSGSELTRLAIQHALRQDGH